MSDTPIFHNLQTIRKLGVPILAGIESLMGVGGSSLSVPNAEVT